MLKFDVEARATRSAARVGRLVLNGRSVETPAFFPVGTQGTVKGVMQKELVAHGVQGMLCNLYHLYLRPSIDVVEAGGGLRAGAQDSVARGGNVYLDRAFPELDELIRATISHTGAP